AVPSIRFVSKPFLLKAVGHPDQGERVVLACLAPRPDALLDVPRGDRTVRADAVGRSSRHGLEHRPADLHGVGEELFLHPPGAVVTRTPLYGSDLGSGHEFQYL